MTNRSAHPTTPHRTRRWTALVVAVLSIATTGLATACGDDSATINSAPDAAAPQRAGGFETDAMANVPTPPDGHADSQPTAAGSTTTQSFQVPGAAADVINSYRTLATGAGWKVISAPTSEGTSDWSMTLTRDSQTLLVTAAPAGDGANTAELSLEVSGG